jgi:hypothetical protein
VRKGTNNFDIHEQVSGRDDFSNSVLVSYFCNQQTNKIISISIKGLNQAKIKLGAYHKGGRTPHVKVSIQNVTPNRLV